MDKTEIQSGRVYRAKKPRPRYVGFSRVHDDRHVLWVGTTQVQYDSPTVKLGRTYPKVDLDAFAKWAGKDVTDEMPPGEWAEY